MFTLGEFREQTKHVPDHTHIMVSFETDYDGNRTDREGPAENVVVLRMGQLWVFGNDRKEGK